jgi:hypothetical protein
LALTNSVTVLTEHPLPQRRPASCAIYYGGGNKNDQLS